MTSLWRRLMKTLDERQKAELESLLKQGGGDGDVAVTTRVSIETGIPLDPRVGSDVQTAKNIERAKSYSPPPEGKPPVA